MKWKAENPEKLLKISRSTTAKNRDRRTKERQANRPLYRQRAREWYANNKEKAKESAKKWEEKNPDFRRTNSHNYRSRKLKAPGQHGANDIKNILKSQRGKCAMPWCRINLKGKYHIDHIIALSIGGSNNPDNLQLLCPKCNWRKHAKDPITFAQENGFLV